MRELYETVDKQTKNLKACKDKLLNTKDRIDQNFERQMTELEKLQKKQRERILKKVGLINEQIAALTCRVNRICGPVKRNFRHFHHQW